MEKYKKSHIREINVKYQLWHGMKNLNYLITPEIMKLLGSTESKITKDKNGENVPYL